MVLRRSILLLQRMSSQTSGHPVTSVSIIVPTLSSPRFTTQWHGSISHTRHFLHHPPSSNVICLHHNSRISVHHVWSPSDKWLGAVPPFSSLRFVSHWKKVSIKVPKTFHHTWSPTNKLLPTQFRHVSSPRLVCHWRLPSPQFRQCFPHMLNTSDKYLRHACVKSHHQNSDAFLQKFRSNIVTQIKNCLCQSWAQFLMGRFSYQHLLNWRCTWVSDFVISNQTHSELFLSERRHFNSHQTATLLAGVNTVTCWDITYLECPHIGPLNFCSTEK
jgi:hypothetical protein